MYFHGVEEVVVVEDMYIQLIKTSMHPGHLRCYDHSKPGKFLIFLTAHFVTTKFCREEIFIIFVNFRCFSRRIKKFHGKILFCSYPSQTPKFIIFQKKYQFFSFQRKKSYPESSFSSSICECFENAID